MALEMKLNLRLQQQLIMTPQLQQAIKLLQLNHLELVEQIQQELTENPFLEETVEPVESPRELPDVGPERKEQKTDDSYNPADNNIDWARYFSDRSAHEYRGGFEDEEREQAETSLTHTETLADHLMWQLQMTDLDPESKLTGAMVGRSLHAGSPAARALYEQADRLLGWSLTRGEPRLWAPACSRKAGRFS